MGAGGCIPSPIKHINPEKAQDSGTFPLNPNKQHSREILQTLVDDTQEPGGGSQPKTTRGSH